MHIAVEGCSHGALDNIYESVLRLQQIHDFKVDLLLCCGDFQSVRNAGDLKCMAVPVKYMQMNDFYKYYSGEKKAPMLTIFIGGNHEASNYLQELPYGGWVAPNIYYMGYASMVRFGGLRIGGLSGIYKGPDYLKGRYESTPYDGSSVRSVYHVRNLEVFRLKQISGVTDVFLSHDWPRGIYNHGNTNKLLRQKTFFRAEVENNTLGSRAAENLLEELKPSFWFAGHLHVKFAAVVTHKDDSSGAGRVTKFLALDKCLPRRDFLQILEIPHDSSKPLELEYDLEWLTILQLTNHLVSTERGMVHMPGPGSAERYQFTPTSEELCQTSQMMKGDLSIPLTFHPTATPYDPTVGLPYNLHSIVQPSPVVNPQTFAFCDKLRLDDPIVLLLDAKKNQGKGKGLPRPNMNFSELDVTMEDTQRSFISPDDSQLSTSCMNEDAIELSDDEDFTIDTVGSQENETDESHSRVTAQVYTSTPITSTVVHERKSLRLSNPKLQMDLQTELKLESALSQPEVSILSSSCDLKKCNDDDRISDESIPEVNYGTPSQMTEKLPVKFRRRNLEIYSPLQSSEDCILPMENSGAE